MNVHKRGYRIAVTEEELLMAHMAGFEQKGHYEPVEPTVIQVAQHARAKAALEELENNPYIEILGYDWDVSLKPLETKRWVADETTEEWLARWRAHRAADPNHKPQPSVFQEALSRLTADMLNVNTSPEEAAR